MIDYLTAILVFITAIYAYITHQMAKSSEASVKTMNEQVEALYRPYINITTTVRPNTGVIYLLVQNTGKSPANNLVLSLDKDFYMWGESSKSDQNIRNLSAFTLPIDSLLPNAELRFPLAQGWKIFDDNIEDNICPKQFTITAQYEYLSKKFFEKNYIDLRSYLGTADYNDPIVEQLQEIVKILKKHKKD